MEIKVRPIIGFGTYQYAVKFAPHLRIDTGAEADINHRTEQLRIDPVLPPNRMTVCFLHEVLHLIDKVFECGLDEATIARLANGCSEFLAQLGIELNWTDIEEMA